MHWYPETYLSEEGPAEFQPSPPADDPVPPIQSSKEQLCVKLVIISGKERTCRDPRKKNLFTQEINLYFVKIELIVCVGNKSALLIKKLHLKEINITSQTFKCTHSHKKLNCKISNTKSNLESCLHFPVYQMVLEKRIQDPHCKMIFYCMSERETAYNLQQTARENIDIFS